MEIRVEKVGNRIHLKSEYRADLPARCKSIAGANWAPSKKVWTFPLDYPTCLALRREFKHALKILPELKAWAKVEKQRHEELLALAAANAADLGRLAEISPALANAMGHRPYQQIGAAWLARASQALLGDQPGLGKTLQAMGAVIEAGITGPILVIAPKTAAIITWTTELRKWLPNDLVWCVTALNGKKREEAFQRIREYYAAIPESEPEPRLWVLCNPEMARMKVRPPEDESERNPKLERIANYPGMFKMEWASAIVDESHTCLVTQKSQDWKMTQQRAGLHNLKLREGALKIAMSGTPMRGKLINLWGTLNWLRPDKYPSFWNWVKKWFNCYDGTWGDIIIGDFKEGMETEFYRDLESILLRRTKGEVLSELPEKMYAGERLEGQADAAAPGWWLPMDGEQLKNYKAIVKDAAAQLQGGKLMANGTLAIMTRLRQFASASGRIDSFGEFQPCLPSNKFSWLVEFLDEQGISETDPYGDSKVLVASWSTRLCNLFHRELEALGIRAHLLTGETKVDDRLKMVEEFQGEGGPRVFIFNTKAGGVSLTLDAADDVVLLDETTNPDDQEQVEDRAHRASRMHQVNVHYLRTLGSIEEELALDVGLREAIQKEMMDGRRGLDITKRILEKV
jgi:SNF2 family DNA or RNA helicase